ncbi:MAG: TRAP transporter substrate-binding protein [Rhodospirillaceae bacterium]|nr:TRAP transporter substrate-binding protein [Rhodospirillaceae bacterium]
MISRRGIFRSAGAAVVVGSVAGGATVRAQSVPSRLRLATYLAPVSHSVARIIKPWMAAIEKDAPGRLSFDVYTGGSLGRSPYAQFDLLRAGVPDIAFAQPSYTTGQFPQLQILETPFLTRGATEASVVAWELCRRGLVQGFDDVKLLGIWSAEPGALLTRVPVAGFADLKNLKIRSSGRLEGEFIESLGATAEAMFPADVYEAMRRHTIHGTVQGLVAVQTFQTYRVSTHLINAPFGVVLFALMMNRRRWDGLPDDLKEIIERHSGQRLALLGGGAYDQRVAEIDANLRAEGRIVYIEPSAQDIDALRGAVKPLVDRWIARTPRGAETYAAVQDIITQLRARERMS